MELQKDYRLLTVREVKKVLNCSETTVYKLAYAGRIPFVDFWNEGKKGKRKTIRFREVDIRKFIEENLKGSI